MTGLLWAVDQTGRVECEGCADHRAGAASRHETPPPIRPATELLICPDGIIWAAYCPECHLRYGNASAR